MEEDQETAYVKMLQEFIKLIQDGQEKLLEKFEGISEYERDQWFAKKIGQYCEQYEIKTPDETFMEYFVDYLVKWLYAGPRDSRMSVEMLMERIKSSLEEQ